MDYRMTGPSIDADSDSDDGDVSASPTQATAASGPPAESASVLVSLDAETRAGIRILVVDDESTLADSCASVLRVEGYKVDVANRGDEARELLSRRRYDIALIDLYMASVSGLDLLKAALELRPEMIAIMMTGNPSVSTSIEALRSGAWDYLPKPFSAPQLQILIGRAAHTVVVSRESRDLHQEITRRHGHSQKMTVLGVSPGFRKAIELARKVAETDASVFITGESGSGKELIAQFIHHHSRRSSRQLVALNCAALPEPLLESEMFGHAKGSFTGAVRDKQGLLEIANGGTLFLDELTEMSPAIQAKLLRVIQDGVVRRVGSVTTDAVVNVRFIAATNRDPKDAVQEGVLRNDLYYRLRVVPIRVPPLRERVEDIPVLAAHFLMHYWKRHRDTGAALPTFTDAALQALQGRPWRGNVRELQNVIEHAVVLLGPGQAIEVDDLPFLDDDGPAPAGGSGIAVPSEFYDEQYHPARERLTTAFERGYLAWLVRRAGGNMSKAARIAGVDRTTLYRLLEKHDLQRSNLVS
jgi:DNA-binding NtrC family response regulator